MGGSAKWRNRVVWTNDENGRKVPLRDANGKIVKVGVKEYGKKGKNILRKVQGSYKQTKTDPYKADRRRVRNILNRNYDDDHNKIANRLTKQQELDHVYNYNKMMEAEPEITRDVTRIAETINAPLLGVEKRRKSVKSATEKYNRLVTDNKNTDENMNDSVRFTNQVNIETFGRDVNKALDEYRKSGYIVDTVKNFWTKPWAYKGINVTLRNKEGKLFEVQFHTKNSFEIKDGPMHKLYEKQRKFKQGSKQYDEIEVEMKELAERSIKTPTGVLEIENINWVI